MIDILFSCDMEIQQNIGTADFWITNTQTAETTCPKNMHCITAQSHSMENYHATWKNRVIEDFTLTAYKFNLKLNQMAMVYAMNAAWDDFTAETCRRWTHFPFPVLQYCNLLAIY